MKSHTSGKMSIGKNIGWVHTLLSNSAARQVFQKSALLTWWIWAWGGKKKVPSTGWAYFSFCIWSSLIAQQMLWANVLVAKKGDKCRKASPFFQHCDQVLTAPGWHCKIRWGTSGSTLCISGYVTLQVAPKTALLQPLCLKTWMGTEKKKGRKLRKLVSAFRISRCFTDVNQPSDRLANRSVWRSLWVEVCLHGVSETNWRSWADGSWPSSPSISQGPDHSCLTALKSWVASGASCTKPLSQISCFPQLYFL